MQKRFVSIWFRFLNTDWFTRRQPELATIPFVLARPWHGKMIVAHTNAIAQTQGVKAGLALADARAIIPTLHVMDDDPGLASKFLKGIAAWCIRYTPVVAVDPPDGLILDVTGCTHLWGGDKAYLEAIYERFRSSGYQVRLSMADTMGCAWAIARFGKNGLVVESSQQTEAMLPLPASALRIDAELVLRLAKLGLYKVGHVACMPRPSLRRRFGSDLLLRIDEVLGKKEEILDPVISLSVFHERLHCLEPIGAATGIEIALQNLLDMLCTHLQHEQKGLRTATFKGYRVDGKIIQISIGTLRPSCNSQHLFKLFQNKIDSLEPAMGIELFTLEAPLVEDIQTVQEQLWQHNDGVDIAALSELLDRISGKLYGCEIRRYIPDEHFWPERSFKPSPSLQEKVLAAWKSDRPRPLQLLYKPEPIEVTAPVPDYPPMLFRYKGKLHKIAKADGPERIEREWWLQDGQHRDYYYVEDEEGYRYWLFRSGHYDVGRTYQWYLHGFFP